MDAKTQSLHLALREIQLKARGAEPHASRLAKAIADHIESSYNELPGEMRAIQQEPDGQSTMTFDAVRQGQYPYADRTADDSADSNEQG